MYPHQARVGTKMKVPKIVRTPMGMITMFGAKELCRYWQEEAEWNGLKTANFWKDAADYYESRLGMNISGWVASPTIEAKLKERGSDKFFHPWEKRHELRRWA